MGIYSCLGTSLEEVTESLRQGKSGIIFDEERKEFGFKSALTGMVPHADLKPFLNRRQRITVGQETEFAYMATLEALKNAGLTEEYVKSNEVGIDIVRRKKTQN